MTAYVYSTRKPTREVLIAGITPITIGTLEYAYKPMNTWPGDTYHAQNMRMQGRVASQSHTAAVHHIETTGVRVFAYGGIEDGAPVYEFEGDLVPSYFYDDNGVPNAKQIGTLYKVGRKWTIETTCPSHIFRDATTFGGDALKICKRCDWHTTPVREAA